MTKKQKKRKNSKNKKKKPEVIDRLAGVIKLDKTYDELMEERYSKI